MAAKEPLRRIASLRQQLQDLASIGCCDPNLVFRTLKDASCDLQEIEEMLCHEKTDNFEDLSEYRRESENPREHDEIYKLLFDNARDGIVLHRLKSDGLPGEMLQVNDAMCKMLGYTREELLRLTPMNLQEEGFEEASKERRRVLNHEKGILFERTLKAKDGRRIPVEIHSTLMDSHGTWGSLSVVRERTDRKNMEIYLQDSRDFLDKIINSIGDPIFVKDEQHRYILVNDAECGLIGHGREEIIGKNCYDFFPEEQARIFWERDKEVFETGREDINEELVTDAVRATHTVITKKTLYSDKAGNKFLVGIARDITDRKLMESRLLRAADELEEKVFKRTQELQEANAKLGDSKDFLDKIINSLSDPIYVKDRQHRLILVNDAACKLFDRSREGLIGRTSYDLFPVKEMADISWEKDEEVFNRGEENVNEETNTYAPGVTLTVVVKKALYKDKSGNEFLVGITRDITDLKKKEEELRAAKEAAEAAARSKSEFLANMSHEIRTPLNAVMGLTGLLLSADLTAEQRDYVKTVRESGHTLLSVINDILDFSKIESGKMELECHPFDLKSCIEVAFDLVAPAAAEKGLVLSFFLKDSLPNTIFGDVTRLRQVLVNLLSNAVKFTYQGSVGLEAKSRPAENGWREIHFSVKDTGIGIPEDKADRLFQSFSQIESSTTRKYGGTGLGLAISKKLVEMMGGQIWMESNEGAGSTFHFTIRAQAAAWEPHHRGGAQAQRQRSTKSAPTPEPRLNGKLRILLAEDNSINQKVALQMLKRLGYNADVAANGLEVLQALERQPYDVVLMDVQMPEMDGFDAAQKIRERWPKRPKIIAVTAYALEGDRERCIQSGMDEYISKPIHLEELRSVLESCL